MTTAEPGVWTDGQVPGNAQVGDGMVISGQNAFKRCYTKRDPGLVVREATRAAHLPVYLGQPHSERDLAGLVVRAAEQALW